jgi:hypothetical protein
MRSERGINNNNNNKNNNNNNNNNKNKNVISKNYRSHQLVLKEDTTDEFHTHSHRCYRHRSPELAADEGGTETTTSIGKEPT